MSDNKYFVTSKRQNDGLKFSLVDPSDALHNLSHCNFTLDEYQFEQYPDFTAENTTEKGFAKGKSIQTTLSFSTFYIHTSFYENSFHK